MSNIFFYSPRCKYCIKCLKTIQPYKDEFNFLEYVNVHETYKSLPKIIKHVPTVVISERDNGNNNEVLILEGKEVIRWIHDIIGNIETGGKNHNSISNEPGKQQQQKEFLSAHDLKPMSSTGTYSSINSINKNLSDTINYENIRSIMPMDQKLSITPDMISAKRNEEIQNFR
ncbi:hypothetical protein [Heterosigma akashiwo virus 01]|jgi:hypothetical protein|uniref:Glutaredoxin domain-containing protein n=1 Tax=Heterosigma akashiwo virus 01 TaxID=97195 RepID=A0A1C9C4X9_HAV01|nr:hypothetical protein D1R72_gp017 [Heterosigma akashiwo virus 01]AOM63348.1 hypothetical protein [Heterosigma akashiwo virus 01]